MEARKINRTELATWAEGTAYSTDSLVQAYREYAEIEEAWGREPDDEGRWAAAQGWLRSNVDTRSALRLARGE